MQRSGRKKVLLIHNTTYYLKLHYMELLLSLVRYQCAVCCVAPKDKWVAELEEVGVRCIDVQLSRRGMNPWSESISIFRLYRLFQQEKPDIVINFSIKPAIYGSLAARMAGVPCTCSMITGLGYAFLGTSFARRLFSRVVALLYRHALVGNHRVFFQNRDDQSFFMQENIVKEFKTVVVNGTGVDTDRFAPSNRGRGRDGIRFLMVARLLTDKGVREFAEAGLRLRGRFPQVRLALLGPSDENPASISESELRCWVEKGALEYLGTTNDVASVLAEHDVFVLPSYREGLPTATLEAMAMGRPVVTTDVPGCRDTVAQGVNGYVVPARDSTALAEAMAQFVENPRLIDSMGRASRQMAVSKYDVRQVNREILHQLGFGDANAQWG